MLELIVAIILISFFGLFVALSFPMKEEVKRINAPKQPQQSE